MTSISKASPPTEIKDRFNYIEHNMKITDKILHKEIPEKTWAKIAFFAAVLFMAIFEGLVINGAYLIVNTGIFILNNIHKLIYMHKNRLK